MNNNIPATHSLRTFYFLLLIRGVRTVNNGIIGILLSRDEGQMPVPPGPRSSLKKQYIYIGNNG